MIEVFIDGKDYSNTKEIRIFNFYSDNNGAILVPDGIGNLQWAKYEDNMVDVPATMTFKGGIGVDSHAILQALSEALGKNGYFPKESHRDKIKAEAVSEEKSNQIEWMKVLIDKHWNK